jgi:amino acid transporter
VSLAALDLVILLILEIANRVNDTWFNFISVFGGYGAIIAYIFICVAALGYLKKTGKLNPANVLGSLIAIAGLGYTIYANFVPTLAPPLDYLLDVFCGTVVAVGIGWSILVVRHSPIVQRVGTSVDEDTADAVLEEKAAELGQGPTAANSQPS